MGGGARDVEEAVGGGVGRDEEEEEEGLCRDAGGSDAMVGITGGGGGRVRSSRMLEMRDAALSATRAMALRDAANFADQLRPVLCDFASLTEFVCVSGEGVQGEHIPEYG